MKLSEARAMHCVARLSATARRVVLALAFGCCSMHVMAIAPEIIRDLAFGDGDVRDAAIAALVASGDGRALPVLEAWRGGAARRDAAGERVLFVDGDRLTDAA